MSPKNTVIAIIVVILLTILLLAGGWFMQYRKCQSLRQQLNGATSINTSDKGRGEPSFIVIDKGSLTLSLIDHSGAVMMTTPIACGINYGDKQKSGDNRTPEGIFKIEQIQDASDWKHDFNDGKGEIEGCYGNWFIRLKTPGHKGIGIHGTHLPESLGTRASEGCIRLENSELERLKPLVNVGMTVVVVPGDADNAENAKRVAREKASDNKKAETKKADNKKADNKKADNKKSTKK